MSTANPVAPCDFVVFGGTGDLAVRKLLPALYLRDRDGQLPAETRIIAASRAGLDVSGYRDKVRGELGRFVAEDALDDAGTRPLPRTAATTRASISPTPSDWYPLTTLLPADPGKVRVFYLACAPELVRPDLGASGHPQPGRRIVAGRSGEADRPRPRVGVRHQRRRRSGLRGIPDLPHRPLPGQGKRAEPARHTVRQHLPGTAVELELDRPRADHGVRVARRGHPRRATTTTPARCATWCRTTCCRCCAWSRWNLRRTSTARPSATRSSRSSRRSSR